MQKFSDFYQPLWNWFHWLQISLLHSNLVYFQYRCIYSWMFRKESLTPAAWLSRDGTPQIYWGGATSRRDRYCACGETSEFLQQNQGCEFIVIKLTTVRLQGIFNRCSRHAFLNAGKMLRYNFCV